MRIAMISEQASPLAALRGVDAGGQGGYVADLSTALAGLGHDVRVYTRRDTPNAPSTVALTDGVEVVHVPAGPAAPVTDDALLPHLREFGRGLEGEWLGAGWLPEIVHAHFWLSGLAAVTAARRCDLPLVQTYHTLGSVSGRHRDAPDPGSGSGPGPGSGSGSGPGQRSRIGYERALGRVVDRVIATCQDETAELMRLGVPHNRISTIPAGVDQRSFCPTGPAAPRSADRTRIISVGRLADRDGPADLIRAMAMVPEAEVVAVGGPAAEQVSTDPQARRLRALAGACGVADRVTLPGAVPRAQLPGWYRSAEVLVCVPWYEPSGFTVLEGMACGVPAVATPVGGHAEMVVDRVTGELVRPRDPHALARSLRRLLGDQTRRLGYGAAGLDRVRHCYSWQRVVAALDELYSAVTWARGRRPMVAS